MKFQISDTVADCTNFGRPASKPTKCPTTSQKQMDSATAPTKFPNKHRSSAPFRSQQQPPQAPRKKQVSTKIPPIVVLKPPEDFRATQNSITNFVSKGILLKKSGSYNHEIFLDHTYFAQEIVEDLKVQGVSSVLSTKPSVATEPKVESRRKPMSSLTQPWKSMISLQLRR